MEAMQKFSGHFFVPFLLMKFSECQIQKNILIQKTVTLQFFKILNEASLLPE